MTDKKYNRLNKRMQELILKDDATKKELRELTKISKKLSKYQIKK